ncbi:hypothetical protein QWY31_15630 [Cytophagales bacterium LB-30]|uniref:Lipoprotein n=1 Tax=Shiella aurantiaca TaxID=3058365 RepID=A0ABT8F8Z5_9BACT|nr:hypothetical protein [Shiella aurantiaca]MDN4166942.1 hypothetical protein [Shiella aurantiaca]
MKKLYIGLLVVAMSACNSGKKPSSADIENVLQDVKMEEPEISQEVIADIIQQIPSPIEISVLLKESGIKYDRKMLNSPENTSNYNSNFKKALNLGIYGTDLGYTNIYEQNQDAVFYLNAIKEMADGLAIGQFFDFGVIKKLATNSKNLDSLLLITTKNFNSINAYLQEQKRANLSILLLTGGWLEALHVTCKVYEKNTDNTQLRETIGEQKIILDNIMLLLSFYGETDPSIQQLISDLTPLHQEFSKIEIVYTYKESTFEVVDGVLVIKDNSSSTINITDENVKSISAITDAVRSKIIS